MGIGAICAMDHMVMFASNLKSMIATVFEMCLSKEAMVTPVGAPQ